MRWTQEHLPVTVENKIIASNGLLFVTFSLIGFSRFDWCIFNKSMEFMCFQQIYWVTTHPEITLQRIPHTDIKNFINKWSSFEEANWMGLDLKIHPPFKALSAGIRCYHYFICFPERASGDVWYCKLMDSTTVSEIRNPRVKEMCV